MEEKKRMSEKEELRKQINKLRERLWAIEVAERQHENDKLVGKFFRYHDSYGGGKKQWWIYYKVVKSSDGMYVKTFYFYIDPETTSATVGYEETPVSLLTTRCREETFRNAWKEIQAYIARLAVNADVE